MHVINHLDLEQFTSAIFQAANTPINHADIVASSLVQANLAGHDSHGVIRAMQYLDYIEAGTLDPAATPVIDTSTGAVTNMNAQSAFGQVAAKIAMEHTIQKAHEHALAATGLYNTQHVGRLGEWVELAAVENLIGLAFCCGSRPGGLVTPFGGVARRFSTNPLAAAVPQADGEPILLDFATSVVAEGKVRVARNAGKSLPAGRILDVNGQPSTDPNDLYADGMLLPAADHKGYGLALLMDLLGGILTGSGTASLPTYGTTNGVLFIVLAVDAFRPLGEFLADSAALTAKIRTTPTTPGVDEVLIPGDPERRTAAERKRRGIPIDETTWQQLTDAATKLGIEAI